MFWSRERFVGLCFLDRENETFCQHHCHNKSIFDFQRVFENFKNGSIDVSLMMLTILSQSFISIDTLEFV